MAVDRIQPGEPLSEIERAALFHARERRRDLAGIPQLHRTHRVYGVTVMAVSNIDAAAFPNRDTPVTFKTAIRVTENSGQHRGIVFEIGDSDIGTALWIGDQTIGLHAGEDGTTNGATALFDNGAELPVGLEMELVAAIRPGDGRVRLWGNGREIARSVASSNSFGAAGTWANSSNGAFAAAVQGTTPVDVPAASQGAPAGFEVIEPLSIFVGSYPRHFI